MLYVDSIIINMTEFVSVLSGHHYKLSALLCSNDSNQLLSWHQLLTDGLCKIQILIGLWKSKIGNCEWLSLSLSPIEGIFIYRVIGPSSIVNIGVGSDRGRVPHLFVAFDGI